MFVINLNNDELLLVKKKQEQWKMWKNLLKANSTDQDAGIEVVTPKVENEVEKKKHCSFLPIAFASCVMGRIVRVNSVIVSLPN